MSGIIKNRKTAIVVFNLGGPDKLDSVKPFLFNLFFDKYIIRLPSFLRYFVAWIISSKREGIAKEIYNNIGGKSPIIEETQKQIKALKKSLQKEMSDFEIFVCMRHWHPMSAKVVDKIKKYSPEDIILLPLYPQFSTTTTASSIEDFVEKLNAKKIKANRKIICCYPQESDFIKAHAALIDESVNKVQDLNNYRILFSAHGLPKKIVADGDPYQWQIEGTVNAVLESLNKQVVDYKITYQSKVGPLEWLGPDTETEIEIAAKQKKELIIVPIAFVSEHVETLVELDIEYKEIADKYSVNYIRVPALSVHKLFIQSLKNIVIRASKKEGSFLLSGNMSRICPSNYRCCPCSTSKKLTG